MKTRHRIVRLRDGDYAMQWKWGIMPWVFYMIEIPNGPSCIQTWDSISDAEKYFEDPTDIVEIVKEL